MKKRKKQAKINLKVISDQGKILLNEINNIEKQISQIEYEKEKSGKDIEKIQNDIQENVSEVNITEQQIAYLSSDLEQKNNLISSSKNDFNSI